MLRKFLQLLAESQKATVQVPVDVSPLLTHTQQINICLVFVLEAGRIDPQQFRQHALTLTLTLTLALTLTLTLAFQCVGNYYFLFLLLIDSFIAQPFLCRLTRGHKRSKHRFWHRLGLPYQRRQNLSTNLHGEICLGKRKHKEVRAGPRMDTLQTNIHACITYIHTYIHIYIFISILSNPNNCQ